MQQPDLTMSASTRTAARFAIVAGIVLAMLIPLGMVEGLSWERQQYFNSTVTDIAQAWGGAQTLSGPYLIVPEQHRRQVQDGQGNLVWKEWRRQRVVLPATLGLDIKVDHQIRRRAIHEVPVYLASIAVSGTFPPIETLVRQRDKVTLLVNEAQLVVGIPDTQGISRASAAGFGDTALPFAAGTGQQWLGTGIHAVVPGLDVAAALPFAFDLQLRGTDTLGFTPVGGTTRAQLQATWPHPSFAGNYLPERHVITPAGFSAEWSVHELARDLPATWLVDQRDGKGTGSAASVRLFQPATDYTLIDRATKYGLLFIALTFLGFLCFELTTGLLFHPVQYAVMGAALVCFYMTLLSLSEHIPFGQAYGISTAVMTALITWYTWAMTRQARLTAALAGLVAGLYTTLFVLLQLEAYALLVGTTVLLAGLVALMLTTRSLTGRRAEAA